MATGRAILPPACCKLHGVVQNTTEVEGELQKLFTAHKDDGSIICALDYQDEERDTLRKLA